MCTNVALWIQVFQNICHITLKFLFRGLISWSLSSTLQLDYELLDCNQWICNLSVPSTYVYIYTCILYIKYLYVHMLNIQSKIDHHTVSEFLSQLLIFITTLITQIQTIFQLKLKQCAKYLILESITGPSELSGQCQCDTSASWSTCIFPVHFLLYFSFSVLLSVAFAL